MITLAILAKHSFETYKQLVNTAVRYVDQVVVAVDDGAEDGFLMYAPPGDVCVQAVHHPLAKNFAAQRNYLCDLATEPWILHLDTDENLTLDLWHNLRKALNSIVGDVVLMPRVNNIDGRIINWPDWQPKLHRAHVRWERTLHEWPVKPYCLHEFPADVRWAILHNKTAAMQQATNTFYATF